MLGLVVVVGEGRLSVADRTRYYPCLAARQVGAHIAEAVEHRSSPAVEEESVDSHHIVAAEWDRSYKEVEEMAYVAGDSHHHSCLVGIAETEDSLEAAVRSCSEVEERRILPGEADRPYTVVLDSKT